MPKDKLEYIIICIIVLIMFILFLMNIKDFQYQKEKDKYDIEMLVE